jgi:hypothetical protein
MARENGASIDESEEVRANGFGHFGSGGFSIQAVITR